jgi:hypothetical protein
VAARIGVRLEGFDDRGDLIHPPTVGSSPVPPLRTIDPPEIAVGVGPFIPDGDTILAQVTDIRFAPKEPKQLVDDGAGVELLGGEQGKALGEIVAHLCSEHGIGAGAGAIGLESAVVEHLAEQVEVALHLGMLGNGERIDEEFAAMRSVSPPRSSSQTPDDP